MTDLNSNPSNGGRFRPIQRVKAAQQVATAIVDAIVDGAFIPGDGLPSERQMATDFGVNRSTVREALRRLEALGFVRIRQGGGTVVRDVLHSAGLHVLPWLIAPGGVPDPALIRDLLELRVMVLAFTARWAAERCEPHGLVTLDEIVSRLERWEGDAQLDDLAFFESLVELTRNRVLALLSNAICDVYVAHRDIFAPLYAPGRFDPALHRATLDALARKDGDAAGVAMTAHGRAALAAFQHQEDGS